MWHVRKTGEVHTGFWWGDPPGNIGVDGRIILKWASMKWDVGVWTGSILLWIGTGGGRL